jgi:hypothetical protein
VRAGTVTNFGQNQLPGIFHVIVNGTECIGAFDVVSRLETSVLVSVAESGECSADVIAVGPLP